jgi:NhaP-type Na+/H+ or K+/H+ antiporter
VAEQIGYGILGGAVAGLAAAVVVALAYRRDLISGSSLQVIPIAGAGLAYGIAVSVIAHGITAAPLARRNARWYESHSQDRVPVMESLATPGHRTRGVPHPNCGALA